MSDHPVDKLLRLAFLEGVVHTRGAYEQAVLMRDWTVPGVKARAARLEERLVNALAGSVAAEVLTVGMFLRSIRREEGTRPEVLMRRLGLSRNIYRMLEHDRISPLKIPPVVWNRIRLLWQVPGEVLEAMIRRSHQLIFFQPSYRATLARYRRKGSSRSGAGALEKAARELYTRSLLPLPPDEEAKMQEFLRSIMEP